MDVTNEASDAVFRCCIPMLYSDAVRLPNILVWTVRPNTSQDCGGANDYQNRQPIRRKR